MTGVRTVIQWVLKGGLAAGFVGLGMLGVALIAMAVTLPAAMLERIVVFILGVGGVLIGVGYVGTVMTQSRNRSP